MLRKPFMRWTRAGAGSVVAAALAAVLYARTLSPGVGAGDSGELVLAARELGIPHPPGYPLWVLLGRLATLLPAGSVAWRVNALSALLGAAAAGLFYLLAGRAGMSRVSRAVATAAFAGSTVLWPLAVVAEVYSLAILAFLALALLALGARRRAGRSPRSDALFFFACGLAAVAHQTLVFPAGAFAVAVLTRGFRPARLLAGLGWAALGFSIAVALPIRSAAQPGFEWRAGEPLGAWLDNLLRRNYGALSQNPFQLDRAAAALLAMGGRVAAALGPFAAAAAALGAILARRRAGPTVLVAVAAGTIPVALMALLAFTPDAEHLAQIAPFLLPVIAAGALYAGLGLDALLRGSRGPARPALAAAFAALACLTVTGHFALSDRRGFDLPERYGRDLLAALPHGTTLVVEGDNETFLTAYLTRVEGLRPDVALVHRRGYIFGDPYRLRGVPRARWTEIAHEVDLERLAASGSPVYYTTPPADLVRSGVRFVNEGLAYRALPPGAQAPAPPVVARRALADGWPRSTDLLPGGAARYDFATRKIAVTYSDVRAHALWELDRYAEALPWFQDAAQVGFDFSAARLNLATVAAAAGEPDLALTELLAARKLDPWDAEPAARLALFLAAAGRHRDAAGWFERAYRIAPSRALASDAARAWSLAGEGERARGWSERAGAMTGAAPTGGSPDETLAAVG